MGWRFNKILDKDIDLAEKIRVRVEFIDDNDSLTTISFKFLENPTDEEIQNEIDNYLENPPIWGDIYTYTTRRQYLYIKNSGPDISR